MEFFTLNKNEYPHASEIKSQGENQIAMKENLLEINELKDFLGYEHLRSIRKWLYLNNIPMMPMGKKTYIQADTLTNFIEAQKPACSPRKDIRNNLTISVSVNNNIPIRKRSKAAQNFLSAVQSE